MATHTYVEIGLAEARVLAGLTGVSLDLKSAREFAVKLKTITDSRDPDFVLIDAMSTAMLIRYTRAFTSGQRQNLGEEALCVFNEEQIRKHNRLRKIRNQHIAHSGSVLETNQPIARYTKENVHAVGIVSVECLHNRVIGFGSDDANDVIELVEVMLRHVDARLKEEKARVLALIREMPLEQFLPSGGNQKNTSPPELSKPSARNT